MVGVMQGFYGTTIEQLCQKLKLSRRSVERYLGELRREGVVYVRFTKLHSRHTSPVNFYAVKK